MQELPRLVVGLCGRARHGKDFVAGVLRGQFVGAGYRCFISSVSNVVLAAAFADGAVKHQQRSECTPEELDILVKFGHAGREADENYWVDMLLQQILYMRAEVALIPGLRFPNEGEWLRQLGGTMVRVTRRNPDGSLWISRDRDPNDPMETTHYHLKAEHELVVVSERDERLSEPAAEWLRTQGRALGFHLTRRLQDGSDAATTDAGK